MNALVQAHCRLLAAHLAVAAPADVPDVAGELERLRVLAWQKMAAPTAATPPDRVLTIKEAAARLQTSPASLYRKRKRLRIGYIDSLDGRLKFSEAELEAYLARQNRAGRG